MSTFECNNPELETVLRYGKEELIALYHSNLDRPEELIEFSDILSKQELEPFSLKPASETEQHNLHQALCAVPRNNLSFKQNSTRPYSRTIINSSKNFSRNTNPANGHQIHNSKFSESTTYLDHINTDDAFEPASLPDQNSLDNVNIYRQPRSRDYFPAFQANRSNNCHPPFKKGSTVISGSWRNSANSRPFSAAKFSSIPDDPVDLSPKDLPEWLDEPTSDFNPKNMTFDNQGKFVPVDSLEEPKEQAIVSDKILFDNRVDKSLPRQHAASNEQTVYNSQSNELENERSAFDFSALKKQIDDTNGSDIDRLPLINKPPLNSVVNPLRWEYIDPQNIVRGPFTDHQMSKWYAAGYFSPSILIKRSTDSKYSHLAEYVSALGSGFFHSHKPIRGFSEYIENSAITAAAQENAVYCTPNDWNAFVANQFAYESGLINQTNKIQDSITNLIGKSTAQSDSIVIDADANEITKRLGFNDPSVMAISSSQPKFDSEQSLEDPWHQIMSRRPNVKQGRHREKQSFVKVKKNELPIGMYIPPDPVPSANMNINNVTTTAESSSYNQQSYNLPDRNDNLYDLVIGDEVKFINSLERPIENISPWAYNNVRSVESTDFRNILEEQERSKKIQMEKDMSASHITEVPAISSASTTVWKSHNYGPVEDFTTIQLEEMRKSQASQVDTVNQHFKPERLDLLRQLQGPIESKIKNPLNWAQWNSPSETVWRQELSAMRSPAEVTKQFEANKNLSSIKQSVISWAKVEISSMYGPKVHADAVIHLLCKFNTSAEMESFIRQSLGTHSKAAQFAVNFHSKLVAAEKGSNLANEIIATNDDTSIF
ncbi:hypothetical protein GJ496_009859 [Pomphorhynchus laevis]|nr:hypothetical protein GJ496_009859 [Pomphorhynchus laevis]